MSSTLFIPPPGLRFRLVGYLSHCAVFSRTTQEPSVGHCDVSLGAFGDQWFTLLHGSGDRAGRYAFKGQMTGKVLYSRVLFPNVGHVDGDGQFEDK